MESGGDAFSYEAVASGTECKIFLTAMLLNQSTQRSKRLFELRSLERCSLFQDDKITFVGVYSEIIPAVAVHGIKTLELAKTVFLDQK